MSGARRPRRLHPAPSSEQRPERPPYPSRHRWLRPLQQRLPSLAQRLRPILEDRPPLRFPAPHHAPDRRLRLHHRHASCVAEWIPAAVAIHVGADDALRHHPRQVDVLLLLQGGVLAQEERAVKISDDGVFLLVHVHCDHARLALRRLSLVEVHPNARRGGVTCDLPSIAQTAGTCLLTSLLEATRHASHSTSRPRPRQGRCGLW